MDNTRFSNRLKYEEILPNVSTCSVYFIIDGSKKMFDKNPTSGTTYFDESVKIYYDVLVQKCLWNSNDLMGLIIFGIDKDNTDPVIENVWVMHELNKVDLSMAKEIHKRLKTGFDFQSVTEYPLLDAIRHASNKLSAVKKAMIFRKVILFTCNDNPFDADETTRHNIRVKADSMKNMDLELEIMGLNSDWNDTLFWNDVRLLFDSNPVINKPLTQMKFDLQKPARIYREVQLYLTETAGITVYIHNIVKRMKYLETYNVNASTNQEVDRFTSYRNKESDDEEDDSEKESQDFISKEDATYLSAEYANRSATFTWFEKEEIRKIITQSTSSGIKIIGFYGTEHKTHLHFSSPYFVTWSKNATKEEKMFFAALLDHCSKLDVMAICVARLHVDPKLFSLLPCKKKGGFYLYKLPFLEQMRNFTEWDAFKEAKENDFVDEDRVLLLNKMIDLNRLSLSECSFKNPKLRNQLSFIQALALNEEEPAPIKDETDPNIDELKKKISHPLGLYTTLYPQQNVPSNPKGTKRPFDVSDEKATLQKLDEIMNNKAINKCTVEQLRGYATVLRISNKGRKAELVNRIVEKYRLNQQ